MFGGAVWVLTPGADTDDATFAPVTSVVSSLGADVVAIDPERHDHLVAVVSHVPHLTAATLMGLASDACRGARRTAPARRRRLPRHDPGGERPAGDLARHLRREPPRHPRRARRADRGADRRPRHHRHRRPRGPARPAARQARQARTNLPTRVVHPEDMAEVRIPIPDRTGAAAEVFTLAAELGVNIASFEVVHVVESNRGVAVVIDRPGDGRRVPRRPDRPRVPAGRPSVVVTASHAWTRYPVRPRRRCRWSPTSRVPPSKSITNRALICAALVDGTSEIIGVAPGDDTIGAASTVSTALGLRRSGSASPTRGRGADVVGTGGVFPRRPIDAARPSSAGTTSRFVTALAALERRAVHDRRRSAVAAAGRWSTCTTRSSPSAPRSSRGRSGDTSRSPCRARCAAPTP